MKVQLSLHASKLKNVAGALGKSDPYAVVTKIATKPGDKPEVLGRTEVIDNTLDPNWVKTFNVEYEMGTPCTVAVQVFDELDKGKKKAMGSATFDIGACLGARGNTKAKKLKNGGTVYAHVTETKGSGLLRLQMKGISLKNVEGFMRKSDPFFELSNRRDSAGGLTWDNVHRSKVVRDNLNPTWETAVVDLSVLCGGDLDKPVLVSVFDFESSGKHVPMGSFETSVNGLVQGAGGKTQFVLKQKGKGVGKIEVIKAQVEGVPSTTATVDAASQQMAATKISSSPSAPPAAFVPGSAAFVPGSAAFVPGSAAFVPASAKPSFIDYVSGGLQLNVTVAIDFTGSNGDPRKPGTLHYLHRDGQRNDYEKAISAIVGILSKYDSDQMFPVYGFGAKYGGVVRHCFQCGQEAEVHGVHGILDAYHQTFKSGLIMSGPTDITEVIGVAAARAESAQTAARAKGQQAYSILLIMSDGAVSDTQTTAQSINQCAHTPLSVVIVGVGTADFSAMRFLDDAAKHGTPDIVQFVEFNKHCRNSVELTSETLHEIPDQVVGYFQRHNIQPLPPVQARDDEIAVEPEDEEIDLSLDIRDDGEIAVRSGGIGFVDGFNT